MSSSAPGYVFGVRRRRIARWRLPLRSVRNSSIALLDKSYDVDPLQLKLHVLSSVSSKARYSTAHAAVAGHALELLGDATAREEFETAAEILQLAKDSAATARGSVRLGGRAKRSMGSFVSATVARH